MEVSVCAKMAIMKTISYNVNNVTVPVKLVLVWVHFACHAFYHSL